MAIRLHSLLLARPGGGHARGGGGRALARPSADSLSGRLRVGFAWRGPCAALRKAACAEGASGASFGRCAPPATGGGPCRRAPAPWTGRGDGAAAPQPPLHAGAALCCLVGSLLDLCATFARLQWPLYCLPRRVARGTRGAARGPESARERWASLRGASAMEAGTSFACCRRFSGQGRSISRLSIKLGGLHSTPFTRSAGFQRVGSSCLSVESRGVERLYIALQRTRRFVTRRM